MLPYPRILFILNMVGDSPDCKSWSLKAFWITKECMGKFNQSHSGDAASDFLLRFWVMIWNEGPETTSFAWEERL